MLILYLMSVSGEDDKNKFQEIYFQYNKLMKYIALDILQDNSLAEDAVHDAFIKIMNNLQKINNIFCPQTKSLIVIIIRSSSIDIYRKRKIINMEMKDVNEDIADNRLTEEEYVKQFETENLIDAIGSIPKIYSDILILAYIHELSTKEIAKILNITVEASKKRLQRARRALKKELERRETNEEFGATLA